MAGTRIPSLNWLRVFAVAAHSESFAKAAEKLHMSTPAVSQQIRALESHLDKPLFERGAQHVRLTDAGKAYWPVVQQALQSIESTTSALFGSERNIPLTIQVNYIFACAWLAPRLKHFQAAHPDIQLQLQTGNHAEDFHPDIAELQIKLGSHVEAIQQGDPLLSEQIYPVACTDVAATVETVSDLFNHRLIEIIKHPSGWYQLLQDQPDINWRKARFCYSDTTQMAMAMAGAGFGIALAKAPTTDSLMQAYQLERCLKDIEADSELYHYLAYADREKLSPAAHVFREWLLAEIKSLSS